MKGDLNKGFLAEIIGLFIGGAVSLSDVNTVLEFFLLACGSISTVYGLFRFIRNRKDDN